MKGLGSCFTMLRAGFVVSALLLLSGCVSVYVDNGTKEIDPSQFKKPDQAQTVQLLFEFQTKGVANDSATKFLKTKVIEQVKSSTLFSDVSETPVASGRVLSITLNNIPVTDNAFGKGFMAGFTFGIVGTEVADGYVCTASYLEEPGKQPIVKEARHVIHATIGSHAPPANSTKAASLAEAVYLMTHQIVSNVLRDISLDPEFK
jgi:hypothetical protein